MPVWPLPRITFEALSAIQETRPVALLTTPDAWEAVSGALRLPVFIQAEPAHAGRDLLEYLAGNLPSRVEAIYVVGQGAPLQAGKLIAARHKRPLVIVPTALESDEPLSPVALVDEEIEGLRRQSEVETGPATDVVIDWDVLRAAPDAARAAAVVDLLSIVTALLDWRLAAQQGKNPRTERFTPWAASVAAGLAAQAIKHAPALDQGRQETLETLLNLLMMTVQLGNQLGHRRATQGSEHYLARILAAQTEDRLPHAELVGPCLLFVAALHGQDAAALRDTLQHAGVRLDQVRATDFGLMLDLLPESIGTLNLPYSILNELEVTGEGVAQALDAAGLAVALDTWTLPDEPLADTDVEADTERVEAPHAATPDVIAAEADDPPDDTPNRENSASA